MAEQKKKNASILFGVISGGVEGRQGIPLAAAASLLMRDVWCVMCDLWCVMCDVCLVCLLLPRETAANDDSMATVMFTNLLSQLDRVRSQEQNFLQRHNMKMIQQQLQVCHSGLSQETFQQSRSAVWIQQNKTLHLNVLFFCHWKNTLYISFFFFPAKSQMPHDRKYV